MSTLALVPAGSPAGFRAEPVHSLTTEYCRRLLAYWRSLSAESLIPSRKSFDPSDILDMLTHILILELPDPSRILFRLIGSAHEIRMGSNHTGRNVLELVPAPLREICARELWSVVGRPCGLHIIRHDVAGEVKGQDYELLFLPIRPRRPEGAMQIIGVGGQVAGKWRGKSEELLANAADERRFIDIGAGVPS